MLGCQYLFGHSFHVFFKGRNLKGFQSKQASILAENAGGIGGFWSEKQLH